MYFDSVTAKDCWRTSRDTELMVIPGIRSNHCPWSEIFAVETAFADQQKKGSNSLSYLPEQGFQTGIFRSGSLGERQGQTQMPLSEVKCPHKLQSNVRRTDVRGNAKNRSWSACKVEQVLWPRQQLAEPWSLAVSVWKESPHPYISIVSAAETPQLWHCPGAQDGQQQQTHWFINTILQSMHTVTIHFKLLQQKCLHLSRSDGMLVVKRAKTVLIAPNLCELF